MNYSGRKRAPLPPQFMQFRDAKSTVPIATPAATEPPSGPAHSPRARHTVDLTRPDQRHQQPIVGRNGQGPPSAPSSRRSRFNDANPVATVSCPPDSMDVDIPGPPISSRQQGGMYADREEVVKDALPKGPRAMAFRAQPQISPTTSPTASAPPQRQPPVLPMLQRSPPPHMQTDTRGIPRAPGIRLPTRPEPFRDSQSHVRENSKALPDAVCHNAITTISPISFLVPGAITKASAGQNTRRPSPQAFWYQ